MYNYLVIKFGGLRQQHYRERRGGASVRPETRAPHRANCWENWTVDLLFSVFKEGLVLLVLSLPLLTHSQIGTLVFIPVGMLVTRPADA